MFKTIVAKYAGSKCRRCGQPIEQGSKFRYGGRGNCFHLAAVCPFYGPKEASVAPPARQAVPACCGDASDVDGTEGDSFLLGPSFPDHDLIH